MQTSNSETKRHWNIKYNKIWNNLIIPPRSYNCTLFWLLYIKIHSTLFDKRGHRGYKNYISSHHGVIPSSKAQAHSWFSALMGLPLSPFSTSLCLPWSSCLVYFSLPLKCSYLTTHSDYKLVGYWFLLVYFGRFIKLPLVYRFTPDHICLVSSNTET